MQSVHHGLWKLCGAALLFIFAMVFLTIFFTIGTSKYPLQVINFYDADIIRNIFGERVLTEKTYQGASQEDPALISYIRHLLISPTNKPYNLSNPGTQHFSESGQSRYADGNILMGMKYGFFVEAGAVDGEFHSNTLFLERNRGWTGLLIEPNPKTFHQLLFKERKAFSINAALAVKNYSAEITFTPSGDKGISGHITNYNNIGIKMKALPLYSILKAMNATFVDFFSLAIEGFEMKVLRTLPWDKIKFRLMCVKINRIPEGSKALIKFMKKHGYNLIGIKDTDAWFGWPKLLNQA
ncbi:hypothetical protein OTU49_004878 [Cherax quadricarinatus]|uniref:Methyltransferase FkbM domain-containing protein n=1 Tax=Cherax quadricarinatus TaxID=27406 RepID=A0AAW0YKH8_CHEQU